MLVQLEFRVCGVELAETKAGAVPHVDHHVYLETALEGRRRYRVVKVTHQYTDVGVRRPQVVMPGVVVVDLVEEE
jgi:hypothetical protein